MNDIKEKVSLCRFRWLPPSLITITGQALLPGLRESLQMDFHVQERNDVRLELPGHIRIGPMILRCRSKQPNMSHQALQDKPSPLMKTSMYRTIRQRLQAKAERLFLNQCRFRPLTARNAAAPMSPGARQKL
jgi:hypothetical protein